MARAIIGKKLGMTQVFKDDGKFLPVTVVKAGPCVVTRTKVLESDGYQAVQLGFEDIKEYKLNKPELGVFKKNDISPKRYLKEFRTLEDDLNHGDEITVEQFEVGEKIDVTGTSKGKGFAGNIKRWNQHAGPKTHGSHFHRAPGSIGAVDASRVFKGQKLPGRMGSNKTTIKNLEIVDIRKDENILLIHGSIPGPDKGIVYIKTVD